MKPMIALFSFLASTTAFANPFDAFIGTYIAVSEPTIRNEDAAACTRFGFHKITGFSVLPSSDTEATHTLVISNKNGFTSNAVSKDFVTPSAMDRSVGIYSTVSGTSSSASVETGSFGMNENSRIIQTISTNGSGYSLVMIEELLNKRGKAEAACFYQVNLELKN